MDFVAKLQIFHFLAVDSSFFAIFATHFRESFGLFYPKRISLVHKPLMNYKLIEI